GRHVIVSARAPATLSWLGFIATAATAIVCIAVVDRPVATFVELHLRHAAAWDVINQAFRPLDGVLALAALFAVGCGIRWVSARRLPAWVYAPLAASAAAIIAGIADVMLKYAFGRSWPDPGFVRDGVYEFRFFQGAAHHMSFPSGTA